jgi:ANTH domain
VVPYGRGRGPPNDRGSAFTSVIAGIRSAVPDPDAVKNAALSSIKAARETTSSISSNLYREVKGLTSSELEQVMLKATRPDDSPVKGKHVERLVGVTYQISGRYDIYDAVLRKLWSKMAEKDWRTTIKALYILHRFSADGAPDHAPALKARLRELRRTRDPKRKEKYFNTKQLMAGEATPENGKYRAFLQRYAHFVLLRTQCFGGMFDEIGTLPKADKKKGPKPITSTCLRAEHLEAAGLLLKAGVACQLKDGEECENTAIAAERVAADLIGLTTAVAIALNRALKDDELKGANPALLKKWCQFYADDLQPQTRAMVKKTSPKLDAFGLFLPSRMGTSVSPELLDKGLNLDETASPEDAKPSEESNESAEAADDGADVGVVEASAGAADKKPERKAEEKPSRKAAAETPAEKATDEEAVDEGAEVDEEYEYEEEDYYDDEEE